MKKFVYFISLTLCISLLAACGSDTETTTEQTETEQSGETSTEETSESSDGKTITWLTLGSGEVSWEGQTKSMLETYEAKTGVHVEGEFYSFNDLFQVIEVKIASGSDDYDVISVDVPMVAGYAERGYLLPMDEYFTEEEKAKFIPSAVEAGTWDGKFYAPPMNTSSQLLWYNKDLLAQAGITVPENDVNNRLTWGEVEEMAKQTLSVVDPDGTNGYAGIMFQQVSRTYQMCALPNSAGEASMGDDGLTVDGVINSQGWIDTMTWYQNLYNENVSLRGINADEVGNYFDSGKVAFMVGGTWTPITSPNVNIGYAPCPTFAGHEDQVGTPTGSWHFGINKASKNPDEAAAFIEWFSYGEGNELWLGINNDVPSTVAGINAILEDPNADEVMKIAAYEAQNTAVPRAITPGYMEYSTIMDATFEDIRNGSDVKTALDNAVSQINTAFEKYK